MTIDKKEVITIPKWLLLLVIPAITGIFGSLLYSAVTKGSYQRQVDVNTLRLDKVEANKVNVIEFKIITDMLTEIKTEDKQQLTRIENKLDDHIAKGTILRFTK